MLCSPLVVSVADLSAVATAAVVLATVSVGRQPLANGGRLPLPSMRASSASTMLAAIRLVHGCATVVSPTPRSPAR